MKELNLNKEVLEKIDKFIDLLFIWNKIHNLTASKTKIKIKEQVFDSLYPIEYIEHKKNILDIGSGAGFPAIPLAIIMQNSSFTLTEPLNKKASFLNIAKIELNLDNIIIYNERVEKTPIKTYDLITSRAVANVSILLDLTKELRDKNTDMLFYKGENLFNELTDDMQYQIIEKTKRKYLLLKDLTK